MEIIDAAFVIDAGLGDYSVSSIGWSPAGEDMILELLPPSEDGGRLKFTFIWAHEVDVKLTFGKYFGQPLIFSSSAKRKELPDTGWEAVFVFGARPDGQLSLSCNSIEMAES